MLDKIAWFIVGVFAAGRLYFAELDHKYNTRKLTDGERTVIGIKGIEGKRLMLRTPKNGEATVLSEGVS